MDPRPFFDFHYNFWRAVIAEIKINITLLGTDYLQRTFREWFSRNKINKPAN